MIFEWQGLGEQRYFILQQKSNPLKYCNYALPFLMPIGLPFMPCDLPNQYKLYSSNQDYTEAGEDYLNLQQDIGLLQRILIPASHRPWTIQGKDYYNEIPYRGFRNLNICCSSRDRPQVMVYLHDKHVGRVRQTTIFNCCCISEIFQQFQIFNEHGQLQYRVCSRNPQRGHFIILPFWGFDTVKYDIMQITYKNENSESIGEQHDQVQPEEEQKKVGQIVHLFNGLAEYTSKNDKYGIALPQKSTQAQKCLLIYCVLLMDYLLFENF